MPAAIALAATLALWDGLRQREQANARRLVAMKAAAVRDDIARSMSSRVLALVRMARRWQAEGRPQRASWESDARLYARHYSGYAALAWVTPQGRPGWLVIEQQDATAMLDSLFEPTARDTARRARGAREVRFTPGLRHSGSAEVFAIYAPVFTQTGFDGFIVTLVDSRTLLAEILGDQLAHDRYGVVVKRGDQTLFASHPPRDHASLRLPSEPLPMYGTQWRVQVWPREPITDAAFSQLPLMVLASGVVVSLLLGGLTHFAQRARSRERKLEHVNRALEEQNQHRRRAEATAERRAEELARSNADLEQFAYVASHDLQEPLRVVAGYVQLLARRYRGKLDDDADEFIDFAVGGAHRMQQLIQDLLAYSRAGPRRLDRTLTDSENVLTETLAGLDASMTEAGAVVTHDRLPEVHADASQLGQVFQNLIGNAIKYRAEHAPRIHVGAEKHAAEWVFHVRDNGIGMDPQQSQRVFAVFQRLHTAHEYSGTGIGLAICKRIIEAHGGRMWVHTQPGEGSVFYFTLPVDPVQGAV